MLKPSYALHCIFPRTNPTIYGVHADARALFLIAFFRAYLNQGGHVLTGMPSST